MAHTRDTLGRLSANKGQMAGPPRASVPRIQVCGVTKRYLRPGRAAGTMTALMDVSMTVQPGEFIALIGASGCGKTSLLRMMSGLVPCDVGEIYLSGQLVRGVPDSIGFVFQQPELLPWRTVSSNLAFALKQQHLPATEVNRRVADRLELTGLEDFARYYPRMLSGGMQQRVGLARALVGEPDVLFMDEPLSALDAFTRRRLQQDVAEIIARAGATTVLVTHEVDEAIFFSDRIVVMGTPPNSIREVIDVPLPRPRRHAELVGSSTAAKLRDRILSIVLDIQ